jgi:hypothetical protein
MNRVVFLANISVSRSRQLSQAVGFASLPMKSPSGASFHLSMERISLPPSVAGIARKMPIPFAGPPRLPSLSCSGRIRFTPV